MTARGSLEERQASEDRLRGLKNELEERLLEASAEVEIAQAALHETRLGLETKSWHCKRNSRAACAERRRGGSP